MKTLKVSEEKPDCRNTMCKYHRKGNKCQLGYKTCGGKYGCADFRGKEMSDE